MRIKDLATRATKLLTGNAYMVFDNGTKVEKVNYAELAKQIITEYNTQTLAGSAQSVKSALDALNSNQKETFNTTSLITDQVDALIPSHIGHTFYGQITSYNSAAATGVPRAESYYVEVKCNTANYAVITLTSITDGFQYEKRKLVGTWDTFWQAQPRVICSPFLTANESISITGRAHSIYIVSAGNWNAKITYIVYPVQGSTPKVNIIAKYAESTTEKFEFTNNGEWGLKITNVSTGSEYQRVTVMVIPAM